MYLGYEVRRYRYLRNECDGSPMDRWAASGASDNGNSAHVELLATPDAPGLFSFKSATEARRTVTASRTYGLGPLNINPLLRKEQVAQGAVAVGATLRRQNQRLLGECCAAHFGVDGGVHVVFLSVERVVIG
jgi:hypothetical protein